MTIDTKRLKTDAAYWDEVAPDGALYFNAENRCFFNDVGFWTSINKEFVETFDLRLRMDRSEPQFIPRPAKPAAPEWRADSLPPAPEWDEELLPPIGCYCVCKKYPDHKCKVVGHDAVTVNGINVVVKLTPPKGVPFYDAFIPGLFRPIPTKAQRDRDELSEIVAHASVLKGGTILEEWQYNCIADAILSRYRLEPKE